MTDPYSVLGVSRDASDEEITRAYRALARKYHPDLNPGSKRAEAMMKNINAAYMQIQAERSGKTWRATQGWGSDTEPEPTNTRRTSYGPYGGYYGSGPAYGGGTYYRRHRRRYHAPFTIGIFGFPLLRLILLIVILRFVLGVVFSLLYTLAGQSYYFGWQSGGTPTERVENHAPAYRMPEDEFAVL